MDFILISLAMVAFLVVLLVLLARAYPGSGADLVDWKPTRSYEVEAQLEVDDVQQMIAAQNEYRRRRGAKEITEDDAHEMAREDEKVRERARQSSAQRLEKQLEDELG
jgi:phage protein D